MDTWYDTLINNDVDEAARISLFLLVHVSDDGHKAANDIMCRLTGGRNDPIDDPSAYIARCVETARRKLNPDGATKYGGMAPRTSGTGKWNWHGQWNWD